MRIILFSAITIILITISCTNQEVKNDQPIKTTVSGCEMYLDTMIYGLEPLKPADTPIEFINIRKTISRVEDGYHELNIEMESIPDSICYNNPHISRGYSEFGMDVILRNQLDSTNIDNIVVSVFYNNFDNKERTPICATFQEFINDCNSYVRVIKENLEDTIPQNTEYETIRSDLDLIIEDNTIKIKIPKKDLCKYYENYLSDGFTVKLTYNDPKESGKNNYYTTQLVSDRWIRHNFMYNSSRRLE